MFQDSGIMRKLRFIDWLKAELATYVGTLLHAIAKNSEKAILEALAGLVITSYVLGRRLGIDFLALDQALIAWLDRYHQKDHNLDEWSGDYSDFERYLRQKR